MPGILHDEREIDTDRRKKRRSAERRFARKMDVLVRFRNCVGTVALFNKIA